jgi:hypothetical protein
LNFMVLSVLLKEMVSDYVEIIRNAIDDLV